MKSVILLAITAIVLSAISGGVDPSLPAVRPPSYGHGCDVAVRLEHDPEVYVISERAAFFCARFADVRRCEYHENAEQFRERAKQTAIATVKYFGPTGTVSFVHLERPEPAGTNILDAISSLLNTKTVVDEVIEVKGR